MAEVTVERVTRRSSRYQPEATTLKAEVGELQNALLQSHYISLQKKYIKLELTLKVARAITKWKHEMFVMLKSLKPLLLLVSQLNNAEGHIVAMGSQLQDAYDRKGSSDINTRQIEDSAQHQYDSLLEQLNTANQELWHVEANAENVVGQIENRIHTLESESEAKLEATLQQQMIMQRTGNQLEETLQQEKMTQMRMLQEGRMLEETLQQNQLQQSHQQGQLQDQSHLIHSQQVLDVKNQQLEAQIARIQQEKAESDKILSKHK